MAYQRFQSPVLMRDEDEDCRLLLIGKTGSGKSATGNVIFNDRVFESQNSSSSVTRVCHTHTGEVDNRSVTVIDTPDFRFSTHTDFDSDSELKRALGSRSAGVHVFLLILPLSTFTEHEKDFIDWFEQKFGVEALRFTLVLFTHADQRHMRSLAEKDGANPQLSAFISRCDQRYHEFNIKDPANRGQVTELMEKIDRLVTENRNSCYTLEMMQETERRREEEERRAKEEKRVEEERRVRERQETLDRVRRETEMRVRREYEEEEDAWEVLEVEEGSRESDEEVEMKTRAEGDAEQRHQSVSYLSETSRNYLYYMAVGTAVGTAVGAAGGAVVGGAFLFGGAVGAFLGGVSGAGRGVIADRAKGGTHSVTESPSGLINIEEAKSNKLS